MKDYIKKVEKWGKDRGLDKTDPKAQFAKLLEEYAELGVAIAEKDEAEIKDAIGDIMVVLTIMTLQLNSSDLEDTFLCTLICDSFSQEFSKGGMPPKTFEEGLTFAKKRYQDLLYDDALQAYCAYSRTFAQLGDILSKMELSKRELSKMDLILGNLPRICEELIGSCLIKLVLLSTLLNVGEIDECYKSAYEVIKNRTGKNVNGVFVKDQD